MVLTDDILFVFSLTILIVGLAYCLYTIKKSWIGIENKKRYRKVEALGWLKANGHELAVERFENKEDAIKFVSSLYKNGADKIEVSINIKAPVSSDLLLVYLPRDETKRLKLFQLLVEEYVNISNEPLLDKNQQVVELYWD